MHYVSIQVRFWTVSTLALLTPRADLLLLKGLIVLLAHPIFPPNDSGN